MARVIGILLIVLGVIGFALGGFTYNKKEKDVDLGPIEVSHTEKKTVPISPIAAGVALVAGVTILLAGSRSKRALS